MYSGYPHGLRDNFPSQAWFFSSIGCVAVRKSLKLILCQSSQLRNAASDKTTAWYGWNLSEIAMEIVQLSSRTDTMIRAQD